MFPCAYLDSRAPGRRFTVLAVLLVLHGAAHHVRGLLHWAQLRHLLPRRRLLARRAPRAREQAREVGRGHPRGRRGSRPRRGVVQGRLVQDLRSLQGVGRAEKGRRAGAPDQVGLDLLEVGLLQGRGAGMQAQGWTYGTYSTR